MKEKFKIYFLLRCDKPERLKEMFREKYIEFSCPENWRNYALSKGNKTIGDQLECVFAYLPNNDNLISNLYPYDPFTKRNGIRKIEMEEGNYYSWELFTQIPTVCFYSRDLSREFAKSPNSTELIFELDDYCKELGYDPLNSSYLLIHNPLAFLNELRQQIPIAKSRHNGNLFPHEKTKDDDEIIYWGHVNIQNIKPGDFFLDNEQRCPSILRKIRRPQDPDYSKLHEFRIYTLKYFFWQFDNNDGNYNYRNSILRIDLPGLNNYAHVFDGKDYSGVKIRNFDSETGKFFIEGVFRRK